MCCLEKFLKIYEHLLMITPFGGYFCKLTATEDQEFQWIQWVYFMESRTLMGI